MASKKVQAALLKQKEAKQKKVLFLLVPVFLGLMAWQGPKTFKAITGGNAPPPTTAAASTTAPTPGSAPSTPGAGAVVPPSQLVDTDAPPSLMNGQMSNLGVFPGRDPFSGGAVTPGLGEVSTGGAGTATGTGTGTTSAATPTSARVEVNGAGENVSIGETFPESDPAFKLVSVTAGSAMISLASGATFTNGNQSEQIKVGETLTVVGDDGSTFNIKLVSTS
jgi:hypothetical protein